MFQSAVRNTGRYAASDVMPAVLAPSRSLTFRAGLRIQQPRRNFRVSHQRPRPNTVIHRLQLEQRRTIFSLFRRQADGSCKLCNGTMHICNFFLNGLRVPGNFSRWFWAEFGKLPWAVKAFNFVAMGFVLLVWGSIFTRIFSETFPAVNKKIAAINERLKRAQEIIEKIRTKVPNTLRNKREKMADWWEDKETFRYRMRDMDVLAGEDNEWFRKFLKMHAKERGWRFWTGSDVEAATRKWFCEEVARYSYERFGVKLDHSRLSSRDSEAYVNGLVRGIADTHPNLAHGKGLEPFEIALAYCASLMQPFEPKTGHKESVIYTDDGKKLVLSNPDAEKVLVDVKRACGTHYFKKAVFEEKSLTQFEEACARGIRKAMPAEEAAPVAIEKEVEPVVVTKRLDLDATEGDLEANPHGFPVEKIVEAIVAYAKAAGRSHTGHPYAILYNCSDEERRYILRPFLKDDDNVEVVLPASLRLTCDGDPQRSKEAEQKDDVPRKGWRISMGLWRYI